MTSQGSDDMASIVKGLVEYEGIAELVINYTKVIKTSKEKSFEEQVLTGWKLIVEG